MISTLHRTQIVYVANMGAIGDTSSPLVEQTVLVNPDGPAAADFIGELCAALEEARLYVDDCFGRADQSLSSRISSLLLRAGVK